MQTTPLFQNVHKTTAPTSAGDCELPILYHDGSILGAFFAAKPDRAEQYLADTPFEPLKVLGRVPVLLVSFEYRDTTIGPYNEVGLAIWVQRRGAQVSTLGALTNPARDRNHALYVVNLPVTTDAARAAGAEIWNYPKYTTGIETDFRRDGATVALSDEFELNVPVTRGVPAAGLPFITFSLKDGELLRTVVDVDHRVRWTRGSAASLRVTGCGPTADSLRGLGLAGQKPVAVFRTDAMRARLPAGVPLL